MQFILIGTILIIIAIVLFTISLNKEKLNFYTQGIEANFRHTEIRNLWKLAKECELKDPCSLYISTPTINKCITKIITKAQNEGNENSEEVQSFLKHLYDYRTRVALETEKKKGLDDTRSLDKGQKLRVILKGEGVFSSKILNNGRELVISVPKREGIISIPGEKWVGRLINVYLWRKNDASYVFDSLVLNQGIFLGESCLYIQHTNQLLRTQKRQSVRVECKIYASMYIIKSDEFDFNAIETEPGYRCLLEDISEDGAMIRIGGVGKTGVMIKLQFSINNQFVMMFGSIKAVEYNEQLKQSRLHFECLHIEPTMKNIILSYVYNVMPEEQKEINEALSLTESDALEEQKSASEIADENKDAADINVASSDKTNAAENTVNQTKPDSIPDIPYSVNIEDDEEGSLQSLENPEELKKTMNDKNKELYE